MAPKLGEFFGRLSLQKKIGSLLQGDGAGQAAFTSGTQRFDLFKSAFDGGVVGSQLCCPAEIRFGVFMRAMHACVLRQRCQGSQCPVHVVGVAFEQPAAAAPEQRVTTEESRSAA